ncbi:hypothetical protein AAMO2058_000318300 [Amorphochlora amoebiformis]
MKESRETRAKGLYLTLDDIQISRKPPKRRGKYGSLYLARQKASKELVTLQVVNVRKIAQAGDVKLYDSELKIRLLLRHQHILSPVGYFNDPKFDYLIFGHIQSSKSLRAQILQRRFSTFDAARVLYQICEALKYCHASGLVHGNIRPEILYEIDGDYKIVNFGKYVLNLDASRSEKGGSNVYTSPDYLSPEILKGKKPKDTGCDIWAVGVILYEMIVGHSPFHDRDPRIVCQRIVQLDLRFPSYVPADAIQLISKILKKDMSDRLSLKGIQSHPFVVKNYSSQALSLRTQLNSTKSSIQHNSNDNSPSQ